MPLHIKFNETLSKYRPISVLTPINKIHETLLRKSLTKSWKRFNLFSNKINNLGSKQKHSITLTITHLSKRLLQYRDIDDVVCGIFRDIAKTFDSVDHQLLIDKLEHYGDRGDANKLLKYYLAN